MATDSTSGSMRLTPMGQAAAAGLAPLTLPGRGPVSIGRARGCDVCLPDPTVSRQHARLASRDGRWYLVDLGGRQGTYLNGVRLEADAPTPASAGDLIRIGPYAFRLETSSGAGGAFTITERGLAAGTIVERVPDRELGEFARRQLDVLIEGAAAITRAADEAALAIAVVDAVLHGTGYPRAAVLRALGSADQVEVLAAREAAEGGSGGFAFSQSLLREASGGHIARLTRHGGAALGQSIERLGINAALCAPVTLDSAVVAYIYLDAREGERPGAAEAVGFCQAISRFTGLALANIKRADLQNRQMRLEEDLRGARQAQAFLCPSGQGSIGPLRYAVETRPGRVVAGDLFDVFPIGSGRVGLCFGDVSGQGMAAGIHMTAVLASLRTALLAGPDPADATAFVNRYMTERSPEHVFVSLWVGVYDLEDGTLRYVDAGHGHWLVKRRGEQAAPAGRPGGLIVGVDAEHRYGALTLRLEPGDRVILYSDGVSERASPGGELFGTERVIAALEGSASPQEDVARLFAAGQEFAGGAAIADDTTAASVERSDA